jgi:serine/threonine protein kinase
MGNLKQLVEKRYKPEIAQPLSLDEIMRISCMVAVALQFCHKNGRYHNNLKPTNILLK